MKTKIKRHSRAVISVILAISMLVSCMMVGIIATDAAYDDSREVGATYYIWVSNSGGSNGTSYSCLGTSPQSFSAASGTNYYIAISTSSSDISSGSVWLTGADFTGLSVSGQGTQGFDGKQAYRFSLAAADTVTVTYSSGNKISASGTGAAPATYDDWYLYGDQFGGWSWTTASTDLTALTLDDTTGYYYTVHEVPESANDRFRIYNHKSSGSQHYKPDSSTQLTSDNNSQEDGVTATSGWSDNYFGLEDNFAGQTVRVWFDTSSKNVWVTPNTLTVTAGTPTGGTVTVDGESSVSGLAADGTASVTLAATPATNYHFVEWESNKYLQYTSSSSATTTATVWGSTTANAVFAIDTNAITLPASPSGYTVTTDQADNTAVEYGASVTVTATPDTLHKITGITATNATTGIVVATGSYDVTGKVSLTPFSMPNAPVTVTVTTEPLANNKVTYGVETASAGMGYVSVGEQYNSESDQMTHTIDSDTYVLETTTVNFCARPAVGYKFVGWYTKQDGSGTLISSLQDYSTTEAAGGYFARFERDSYLDVTSGTKLLIPKKYSTSDVYLWAWDSENKQISGATDWPGKKVSEYSETVTINSVEYGVFSTNETNFSYLLNTGNNSNQSKDKTISDGAGAYVTSYAGHDTAVNYAEYNSTHSAGRGYATTAYFPIKYYVNNAEDGASTVHSDMFAEAGTSNTITFNHAPADTSTTKVKLNSTGFSGTNYTNEIVKDNSTTMTMPDSYPVGGISFTAEFIEKNQYAVTFASNDASKGTVTATVDGVAISSGDLVYEDKVVTFTADSAEGYYFNKWTGDVTGPGALTDFTDSTATYTVDDADVDVTGNFRDSGYRLYIQNNNVETYYQMEEITGGLYVCKVNPLSDGAWFDIYKEKDGKFAQGGKLEITDVGRSNGQTITEWDSLDWWNDYLKLNNSSVFGSANTYIVIDPATGEVWATKDVSTYDVTLAATDNAAVTASYGGNTIAEGGTIEGILAGESVSINAVPETPRDSSSPVYTIDSVTGIYDTDSEATITGGGNARTMTMPAGNTTVTVTMKEAALTNIYFNNYYSKYDMVSAYAWYGNPNETGITYEPLGMWSGRTMTKLNNTNTWVIQVPEGTPYIIFVGKGGTTRSAETVDGVEYYHITIPWENNPPMYTAGSDKTDPTDGGTWDTYVARSNEITVTKDTDTMNTAGLYTALSATMYDYYVDNEITAAGGTDNWLTNIKSSDYTKSGDSTSNPFKKFNDAIDYYSSQNNVEYPMYFGNFYNITDSSTDNIIKVTTGDRTGQKYFNWSYKVNNSNGLSNGANALTGLSGLTLDGSNINHYKSTGENQNGVPMAMFDEDFLSGENIQKKNLATILRSDSFPVRKTTVSGYTYYTFDSSSNDTAYITNINKSTNTANISYYNNNHLTYSGDAGSGKSQGFYPFDYTSVTAKDGTTTTSINNTGNTTQAHDLGFGMKIEIPFTINENGTLEGTANGTPQTFDFSGDDDLWVYIDGHLVLDLGGDHNKTTGSINFKTLQATANNSQKVKANVNRNQDINDFGLESDGTTKWFDNTKPNVVHTMTLYYVERGMWASNLKFGFSFHPVPNMLTVDKKVRTHYVNSGFFEATGNNTALKSDGQTAYKNSQGSDITQFEHTYQADYTDQSPSKTETFTVNQSSTDISSTRTDGSIVYSIGDIDTTVAEGSQGTNHSFNYTLYNDQGANFIQQYDKNQTVTLSETIPENSLYHYYANGDTLPDGSTFADAFAFTNIAQLDASGKETSIGYTSGENGYTITMPAGDESGLDDIRVRARFTNQMKTHNITLVKNVNDSNPDAEFTFVVKFKFGDYDYEPYKLYCVVDGNNVQMNENGEIVVKHGHSVIIPNVPENVSVQVSEKEDALSDYAFNEMVITDSDGDTVETTGSVLHGAQFTTGTKDLTATVRNTKSELNITHTLLSGSEGTADCYVSAQVIDPDEEDPEAATKAEYSETSSYRGITIDPIYVKHDSTFNLIISLRTDNLSSGAVFSGFYEQIFTALNAMTAGSNKLDLNATVTINTSTKTASIEFPIAKLFDATSQAQRARTLPFYSKLDTITYKVYYDFQTYRDLYGMMTYQTDSQTFTSDELANMTVADVNDENGHDIGSGLKFNNVAALKTIIEKNAPYEDGFMEKISWISDKVDSSGASKNNFIEEPSGATLTSTGAVVKYNPSKELRIIVQSSRANDLYVHATFKVPYSSAADMSGALVPDTTKVTIGGKEETVVLKTDLQTYGGNGVDAARFEQAAVPKKSSSYYTAPERIWDATNSVYKYFSYWEVSTNPSDNQQQESVYTKCYSREFNLSLYQDSIIKAVYLNDNAVSPSGEAAAGGNYASITFMENSRSQWNATHTSTKPAYKGNDNWAKGDRVYTDFLISYAYNDLLLKSSSLKKYGLVIEEAGDLSSMPGWNVEDGATKFTQAGYIDAAANGLLSAPDDTDLRDFINSDSTKDGDYLKSEKSTAGLDNKNRIDYYYAFPLINQNAGNEETYGTPTGRENKVYRAYSYLKDDDGSILLISNPLYFTIYDIANIDYLASITP